MAIMNAHMGEVFWARFEKDGALCKAISKEQVGSPEQCLAEIAAFDGELAGDGLRLLEFTHLSQEWVSVQPDASYADRKSTRLNSSHVRISYAVFCLKKKKKQQIEY